jgi:chemotaxis signal transduction protein
MSAAAGSFVLLHIGERRFAFPAGLVTELAPAVRLHRFPHTSSHLLGVIMRRGKIVPVYDQRSVFGAKRSSANLFYLLAECNFGAARELFAVPINGESVLVSGELQPSENVGPEYVAGFIAVAGERIDVLDLNALIASTFSQSTDRDLVLAGVRG